VVQIVETASTSLSQTVKLRAGTGNPLIIKPGPSIAGAVTAGSIVFPINVAPDGYVAVYGSNLTGSPQPQQAGVPYPEQLADVQVLVNGAPAQIQFISQGQINIVYPDVSSGLTQFTVKSGAGLQTVNVLVAPAVPSVFTLDETNNGPAAAENGSVANSPVVGPGAPLHAGDIVELYVTGLGHTAVQPDGLSWAQIQPTVGVGGQNCSVTFAGLVPGYTGLGQVNCRIPAGVAGAAVPVIVTSSGRPSNAATLNIQ